MGIAVLLGVALTAGAVAHAGEADSKTFFAEGRNLRQAGDCRGAIDAFRRALKAWHEGLGALRNMAECQQELHLYASARRSWWDLRREVLKAGDEKYTGWAAHAEEKFAELGPVVPRLVIELVPKRTDVTVAINGELVAAALVGTRLERDVGSHEVEVFASGKSLAFQRIALEKGVVETLRIELPPAPPAGAEPGEVEPGEVEPAGDGLATTGYVLLGVGGAAVVGAVIAFAVRQSALTAVEKVCPGYDRGAVCPASVTSDVERGRTASLLVNVLGIAGLAGLGAGAALLIAAAVGDDDGVGEPTGWLVVPVEGGAYVGWGGSF